MTPDLDHVFATPDAQAIRLTPVLQGGIEAVSDLTTADGAWITAHGFSGAPGSVLALPASDGKIGRVLVGIGKADGGDPCGPAILNLGRAAAALPTATYALEAGHYDPTLAAIAWGLGSYQFTAFKANRTERARLVMPEGADAAHVTANVGAVHVGRDLINTPANALGPDEIAHAVQQLADADGAACTIHRGEDAGFEEAFPLVHAVGRASPRMPRVADLTWGDPDAPKVTLIGKGVAFDTGGLDLKPASAMLLMKKDMGGSASAIAAARIIMELGLPVRLRLIVSAAENSVAGNAFRPGDVITARSGTTVEIGNTDAEGRLVLADAMALADDDAPTIMITFATLTGSARVALGADLPAMFSTDDSLAHAIEQEGLAIGDPVWRMPFWSGYDKLLKGKTGDLSNISEGPFAGAITAALFLKRFTKKAHSYAHFDMYGWRQSNRALGPKGGETHAARAVAAAIASMSKRLKS